VASAKHLSASSVMNTLKFKCSNRHSESMVFSRSESRSHSLRSHASAAKPLNVVLKNESGWCGDDFKLR